MRFTAASEVRARVKYQGKRLETAAAEVIAELRAAGGEGGLIAIDARGTIAMPYSTRMMMRGEAGSGRESRVVVEG